MPEDPMMRGVGDEMIRQGMELLFTERGLDPASPALTGTADRWLSAFAEFTAGYGLDPAALLARTFPVDRSEQMIVVTGVPFTSMCEHHLLPFTGTATIAYMPSPGAEVVGLSKLPRLLDLYARRLQTQEQLTVQVTGALDQYLDIEGAACLIQSEHGCLAHRGARKPGSVMVTSSYTGTFEKNYLVREELHALTRRSADRGW